MLGFSSGVSFANQLIATNSKSQAIIPSCLIWSWLFRVPTSTSDAVYWEATFLVNIFLEPTFLCSLLPATSKTLEKAQPSCSSSTYSSGLRF
jgi:hypothetical protein